jgi:hypothetical protein
VTFAESANRDTANTESEEDQMKATRRFGKLGLLFCMAILMATFGSPARADESNKLTIFTFSAPVELPGDIVLSAGTYVFKLLDVTGDRNVVQILDQDQTKVYAIIFTIPVERLHPADQTIVQFYETANGPQNALKTWFYPGEISGQEFVYPKGRASELAKITKQPVTVISSNLTSPKAQP